MEMYIKIEGDDDSMIRFPVLPPSYERQMTMNHQQVNVNKIGTVNLIGKPGLRTIQIDSFFPHEYNESFCQIGKDELKDPISYCKEIDKMRKKVCRLIITGSLEGGDGWMLQDAVNMTVLIDSFNWGEKDGTRDFSFSLSLSEYVKTTSTRAKVKSTKNKTYKTKAKDTLKKIAKKKLKDPKKWKVIYNNNIKKCNKAFKSSKVPHSAKKKDNGNKKRALQNKWFPKGVKLTIPVKS